ncbi:MAG: hypothetical protein DLM50_03610 [Candidatus Meridianibacter frigidus]|nr:MAG: hypothetical protein DLM50_03610 [Candidatus Eremiobacteraeota bacterium]
MSFLVKWLGLRIERPASIAVRPSRAFTVPFSYDWVFERALSGMRDTLGADISREDRAAGVIEGAFGLLFSERISCSLTRQNDHATEVRLESRRSANAELPKASAALQRLEQHLKGGIL